MTATELLPCRIKFRFTRRFILPEVSEIEGEIDLWTKEIEKNFRVIRATSYEEILERIIRMSK